MSAQAGSMRAIGVFPTERRVGLVTHPMPSIQQPDDILIRIQAVGICGTDRAICRFEEGTPPPGSPYLIPGHEAVGVAVAVGSATHDIRPGDLVALTSRRTCQDPACIACRHGRSDFCATGTFVERGIKEAHGFMAEYVVDQRRWMTRVPPTVAEFGVFLEPLAVVVKGFDQIAQAQGRLPWFEPVPHGQLRHVSGLRALIMGAGPIGLLAAAVAVHAGYETVITSREPDDDVRAHAARALGAHYHGTDAGVPGTFDVVVDATGSTAAMMQGLAAVAINGCMLLLGISTGDGDGLASMPMLLRDMVLKNQVLIGSVDAHANWDYVVECLISLAASRDAGLRRMITNRVSPAYGTDLLRGARGGIKDIIIF